MTNRENPVWQMAYAAKFASMHMHATAKFQCDVWHQEAAACADAAVEALSEQRQQPDRTCEACRYSENGPDPTGCASDCWEPDLPSWEPIPATPPQPRDESSDMWVWKEVGNQAMSYRYFLSQGERLPWREEVLSGERYVPYSQLEAHSRDSQLLDAILDAAENGGIDALSSAARKAIDDAFDERTKR